MTLPELARLLLAGAFLVVLPGFLLVQAAFPPSRSRLTWTERAYLVLVGGVSLLALVGVLLGSLPHGDGRGYFQTFSTGAPFVELGLAAACLGLFYVGARRGAYPALVKRYPALSPAPRAPAPRAPEAE